MALARRRLARKTGRSRPVPGHRARWAAPTFEQRRASLLDPEIEVVEVSLDPDRTGIDVGAPVGFRTLAAARRARCVRAIEPIPEIAEALLRRVPRHVRVRVGALSDRAGSGLLSIPSDAARATIGPAGADRDRPRGARAGGPSGGGTGIGERSARAGDRGRGAPPAGSGREAARSARGPRLSGVLSRPRPADAARGLRSGPPPAARRAGSAGPGTAGSGRRRFLRPARSGRSPAGGGRASAAPDRAAGGAPPRDRGAARPGRRAAGRRR